MRDQRPAQLTLRFDLRTRSPATIAGLFLCAGGNQRRPQIRNSNLEIPPPGYTRLVILLNEAKNRWSSACVGLSAGTGGG